MKKFHTIVIGGGSAGLVCSYVLASMGANVALVEKENMGGDCLHTGCVPSKALIKVAHNAHSIRESKKYGINADLFSVDMSKVIGHIAKIIEQIEPHDSFERYTKLGVNCIKGDAEIVDKSTVSVNGQNYKTKYIVIATGSTAFVPPIKGIENVNYYTNESIFKIDKKPERLIVLGAGPIGLELGQSFARLGSDVTVIDMAPEIFMKEDKEVAPVMHEALSKEMTLLLGAKIEEIKKENGLLKVIVDVDGTKKSISGDALLVALGRKPVSDGLGLEKLGVVIDKRGFVVTSKKLRTSVKNIYACGDVVGPFQFTHMAGYQGALVARNIVIPFRASVNYSMVAWNTYTDPEVSHVGYTEEMAKADNLLTDVVYYPMEDIDRTIIEENSNAFVKLILGKKGRIIGATMLGKKSGEMIPFLSLAIKSKMKISAFSSLIFAYPSETEVFRYIATSQLSKSVKPWMKKLLKILFIRE